MDAARECIGHELPRSWRHVGKRHLAKACRCYGGETGTGPGAG